VQNVIAAPVLVDAFDGSYVTGFADHANRPRRPPGILAEFADFEIADVLTDLAEF